MTRHGGWLREPTHMTSDKKIAANRLNAKKSIGPRTQRGKSRASRNAWRHGWAVAKTGHSKASAHVESMAKAICGGHGPPALYEQVVIIAECEMRLLKLRAARVAAIHRNRSVEPGARQPNELSGFPTTERCGAARSVVERAEPRQSEDMDELHGALPELVRLDHYERRAISRRNRAIRMFEAISIVTPFLGPDGFSSQ
jgi:hypothetical protein